METLDKNALPESLESVPITRKDNLVKLLRDPIILQTIYSIQKNQRNLIRNIHLKKLYIIFYQN